jgi:preprotein translocase subunit SecG
MFAFFTVLIIIVSILLVLVVLVQNSKGGGLASNFSSAGQFMGVRKTTDFLEKATWSLAGALVVFTILATATIPRGEEKKSVLQEQVKNTVDPNAVPSFPTNGTQQQQGQAAGNAQPAAQQQQPAAGQTAPATEKK